MEEKNAKGTWRNVIVAVSVTILMIGLQFLLSFIVMFCFVFAGMLGGGADTTSVMGVAVSTMETYIMEVTAGIQFVTYVPFLLWYYFAFHKKKVGQSSERITVKKVLVLVILGFGFYCLTAVFLSMIEIFLPRVMENYNQLIHETGIAGLTFASTIVTLVIAPIGEEVVYRGLTLKYIQRAGSKFFLANIVQALLFGLIHGNFVQSSYAFFLGLFLGYIAKEFRTLKAAIIFHLIFNFFGTYVATALEPFIEWPGMELTMAVLGMIAMFFGLKIMKKQVRE